MVERRPAASLLARPIALVGLVLASVVAAGCVQGPPSELTAGACSPASSCPDEPQPACAGDDPATFCDDCNPCTVDMNCTPCSTLLPAERDIDHCTADEELPELCAGHAGCVHVAETTPAGQINDCFPVAVDPDLHAGVCRAGACVDDGA